MQEYEFFIEQPMKVVIQANSKEEAIQMIKQQLRIPEIANVKFTQPIYIESNITSNTKEGESS